MSRADGLRRRPGFGERPEPSSTLLSNTATTQVSYVLLEYFWLSSTHGDVASQDERPTEEDERSATQPQRSRTRVRGAYRIGIIAPSSWPRSGPEAHPRA